MQRDSSNNKTLLNGAVDGVYVHIPFCTGKCRYCSFVSSIYDNGIAGEYLSALIMEAEREAARYAGRPGPRTLYIGGGTPTCLGHEKLSWLVRRLKDIFSMDHYAEITVESNPDSLENFDASVIYGSGINRVSLGAQSFVQSELRLLGRRHSVGDIGRAVGLFRDAGFDNIGLDLIYSLPGQMVDTWRGNVRRAIDTGVEHISMYDLSIEPGTKLHAMAERGEVAKPGEDIQTEMYLAACEALEDAGHAGYEISNFAKPGRECRHNLNYWRQGGYVGLGVSAHSHISGRRWVNIDDITSYIGGIKAGGEVISGETVLSEADMAREEVMLGLRTAEGIDLTTLAERHGHDFARNIESVSIRLEGGGLVRLEGKSVYLTRAGALVSNTVITEFF